MNWFYYSIFIDTMVEQAHQLCLKEIAFMEMALELDEMDAELDEIGDLLDDADAYNNNWSIDI